MVKDSALTPDTGQSPAKEQTEPQEEPQAAAAAPFTCSPTTTNNSSNNYNLVTSLLNLTKSPVSDTREHLADFLFYFFLIPLMKWVAFFSVQDGRIVVKACEGLMLLVSLPEPAAAKCLIENTELCELLTERLVSFYKALPQSMDPLDIETVESVNWG